MKTLNPLILMCTDEACVKARAQHGPGQKYKESLKERKARACLYGKPTAQYGPMLEVNRPLVQAVYTDCMIKEHVYPILLSRP